jgi:hypothetical protein
MTHEDRGFRLIERSSNTDTILEEGIFNFTAGGNIFPKGRHNFTISLQSVNRTHDNFTALWTNETVLQMVHEFDATLGEELSFFWRSGVYGTDVSIDEVSITGNSSSYSGSNTSPLDDPLLLIDTVEASFASSLPLNSLPTSASKFGAGVDNHLIELESNTTEYQTLTRSEVLRRLNVSVEDIGCPSDVVKRAYLGRVAALNRSEVVCGSGEREKLNRTVAALQQEYVARAAGQGRDVNHIVVASPDMAVTAAYIAAEQEAFLTVVNASDAAAVSAEIDDAVRLLGEHGMYLNGTARYTDGLHISLLGVPSVTRQDPVEQGTWRLHDPRDGEEFSTDLPYGDVDGDGWPVPSGCRIGVPYVRAEQILSG